MKQQVLVQVRVQLNQEELLVSLTAGNPSFFFDLGILGHSHGWIRVIETWHGLGLGSTIGKSWMLFDSSRPGGPGP